MSQKKFHQFVKNIFEKNTLLQNSLFLGTKIAKNHQNCLEYERVIKIFYFQILNIAKFG